ncbi:Class II histone deacetylase complex subunits 2 and 3 [Fragilaria crotonensis]|nr:Class II histone deacetylase complex subunits 2 and 3 [Fragilaria crotonensis]
MAPQVKRYKTAFQYYQADHLGKLRKEITEMSACMTELSSRWKALSDADREHYMEKERIDRERYQREAAEADAEKLRQQEENRLALIAKEGRNGSGRIGRTESIATRKEEEAEDRRRKRDAQEAAVAERHTKLDKDAAKKAAQRLEYLLNQSDIFAKFHGGSKKPAAQKPPSKKKSHRDETGVPADEEAEIEEEAEEHVFLTKQPSCIAFGQLKGYQLEGLNWMIHLAEKGLNGILADEMGLGKTLQSISILAYHWEFLKIQGPHLICVPKSTLSNWMNELARWCPSLRVIRFHGNKDEREAMKEEYFSAEAAAHDGSRPERRIKVAGEWIDDNSDNPRAWDVCVTTYEICNTERKTFQRFAWKYLIIDEAHRLKNEASMFSKTVRTFHTQHRLLLTGTPLQNNLHELWALLNFLLPDIFSSADQFDEWFNLEIDDEDAKKQMISTLHKILRPL